MFYEELNNVVLESRGQCLLNTAIERLIMLCEFHCSSSSEELFAKKTNTKEFIAKKKATKQNKAHQGTELEEVENEKKVSMRKAEQVISRIKWDAQLSIDDFSIGYLDRFIGVIEKPFALFSWEDIASVDNDVLAIPQHRIQYFKYKGVKVWDKNSRLDNVFGSTGSGLTINDVVKQMNQMLPSNESTCEAVCDDKSNSWDHYNDDSDDDNITVTIDQQQPCLLNENDGNRKSSFSGHNQISHHTNKPTHFFSVPITDLSTVNSIQQLQEQLISDNLWMKPFVVPTENLHMSLCLLSLISEKQRSACHNLLSSIQNDLQEFLKSREQNIIKLKGVDTFHGSVLYAKVQLSSSVEQFVSYVRTLVVNAGLTAVDSYDFVPHVSLFKFTGQLLTDKSKSISKTVWQSYASVNFGQQALNSLEFRAVLRNLPKGVAPTPPISISLA